MLISYAAGLAGDSISIVPFDGLEAVEPFSEDHEANPPPGVQAWRAALADVDAVLISTPEYNGSIPGQLKNALDWASRGVPGSPGRVNSHMYGKPVAVVSASTGSYGGAWSAQELRKSLARQGSRVFSEIELAIPKAAEAFNELGELQSPDQTHRLTQLISELAQQARSN